MKNYKYKEVIDILNNSLDSITDDKVTCVNDIYNLIGDINQDNDFEILTAITSGDIKNVIKIIMLLLRSKILTFFYISPYYLQL